MITVAGFNTAIDRRIDLAAALESGCVQRAAHAQAFPGGKGLHVAQMVAEFGEPVRLVGLTDAAHGERIADHLESRRVQWHGIPVPHDLRQCLMLREPDGRVTEILESGSEQDATTRDALLAAVRTSLDDSDALVLSGSLPSGFDTGTYANLACEAAARGLPCLLDASGDALRRAAAARPWLVKPNAQEAAALTGAPVHTVTDALECVRRLHRDGVARAVVTLGDRGAVGFDGTTAYHVWLETQGAVRNSVGSGDCFLAALAVGAVRGAPFGETLRRAVASGTANAQNEETGYARRECVDELYARVQLTPLVGRACS